MKLYNETDVRHEVSILQVALVTSAIVGTIAALLFMLWGNLKSLDSKAASITVASGDIVYASDDPFGSLSSGDTVLLYGKFYVDQNYGELADSLVIIADGTNSEIKIFSGNQLYLGAGSSIQLLNSAKVKIVGQCDSVTSIYIDSTRVATCDGTGGTSFADLNNDGGIDELPVEWLSFTATNLGDAQVELRWATAMELNNDYFQVEYSADGVNWMEGPRVHSKAVGGNSNQILDYSVMHYPSVNHDQLYYRVMQVDYTGVFDYSDVRTLRFESENPMRISTLGNSQVRIQWNGDRMAEADLVIYDMTGSTILKQQFVDNDLIQLPAAGVYILEVASGAEVKRVKQVVL